jgi:hypothetical protein
MLVPVATPIVYARREEFGGDLGMITAKSPAFDAYQKMLTDTVSEGYARLLGPNRPIRITSAGTPPPAA